EIPAAILSDPNPLWRCYVVGHFIGDAPHVGSIHATVNRIWTQAKGSPRIDVQFIEKNTKEKNLNVVNELLRELEEFPIPLPQIGEGTEERAAEVRTMGLSLVEQTTNECGIEAFVFEGEQQGWSHVNGRPLSPRFNQGAGLEMNDKEEGDAIIISPSRFSVLAITEGEGGGEENTEIEEGEVVSEDDSKVAPLKGTKKVTKQGGTATSKHGRRKVVNTRDLKLMKEFLPTVAKVWASTNELYHSRASLGLFQKKLKLLKFEMRAMNRVHYGDLPGRTKQAYEVLCVCQNQIAEAYMEMKIEMSSWLKILIIEGKGSNLI
ncbi:hypothetical protein HID58_038067, partial [Brassica napus]